MKLCFLVVAWLVHATLFGQTNSLQDFEADIARISEKVLSSFAKSLSKPLSRQKREPGLKSLVDDNGVYHVVRIKPVSSLCHPAIKTLFVDVSNMTYAVCVTAETEDWPSKIVISYYQDPYWVQIHELLSENAVDVAAFVFNNYLYILAADTGKNVGSELFKIDLKTHYLISDHSIHGRYATSISVWKMKNGEKLNLAIANSNGYMDAANLTSNVFIYEWKGTYFDQYETLLGYDVKDIEPFHIYGTPYLAIANFKRGVDLPRVDSEIFRFDLDKKRWVSFQKISTHGAMDWEFFSLGTSLGQEFFLAVANYGNGDSDAKSMIYKFVEDRFVPFQCLPTTKATSFATFSRDNLFILTVANENDAVHIYQYDGWRFVKSGVQFTTGAMAEGAVDLSFHEVESKRAQVLILSVSNPRHRYSAYKSVYEIEFVHENPLKQWYRKSNDWCLNMLETLSKKDLDKEVGLNDVINTDQASVTIDGDVVFEKGFETGSLRTSTFTDISSQEVFDYNLINKLKSLQERLDGIKHRLDGFSAILNKSMKIDGNQTILSNLEFQNATFSCKGHSCHFRNINTEVLNEERIADWENRVIFTDQEQNIDGTLMAREIKAKNLHVLGLIDGVEIKNLVTKSGSNTIDGYKLFNDTITAEDMVVAGTVDGIVISPNKILLSTGDQTIYGDKYFENLNTTWLNADKVNKKDLTEFYKDLVIKEGSYEISGVKTFNDITVDHLTMTPHSTINGIDLVELWEKALWLDGRQEIEADVTFSDVAMEKNLDVSLGINGVKIPGQRVVDITSSSIFGAPQTFLNSTYIQNLKVLKSLNGISVLTTPDGSSQLDIFLKIGNQVVTGSKTFHTIHLDADSDVYGRVDGVDLSELQQRVLRKNSSIVTDGTWVFDKLSIKGPLTVEGKVNGVDLKDVYERALKLTDSEIPTIQFNANIEIEDLHSKNINNINIEEDLVLKKNKRQTIIGKKYFEEVILEENSVVLGLVNNVNMSSLNNVLLKIGNQHVESKIFNSNVVINNLIVEDSINNVPLSDIMFLQGGNISGSRVLENVTFSTIEAKNIEVTGKVNGINIKEMFDNTMTYDGKQDVTGVKTVAGTIYMLNNSNLQTDDFNGINLSDLWNDSVFIDVEQTISGPVEFKENVVFHNLSVTGTIDGVTDREIQNWMLKDKYQVVSGESFFQSIKAENLTLGTVNNLNLTEMEYNIVKVNEASEIMGTVIFDKSITSKGNVNVVGKVQGIELSEEAVLKSETIYVSGEKTFSQDIIINGPLTVDGKINDIDIEEFCNKAFVKNKDINVTRLVIKGDVVIEQGIVEGSLAGVELQRLKETAVRDNGSTIKISGLKTFKSITFEGPVTIKGKFGSVDINELARNYMSLSKEQEIASRMEFKDVRFEGLLSAKYLDTADGKINNQNWEELSNRILKTSQTQNVTATYYIDEVHFLSDVFVAGKVNGIKLPEGVMIRNHTNYIESPKIFEQPLVVLGNMDIDNGKKIQGIDVSEWFSKAVFIEGKFLINGTKIFNELFLNDVKVEGMFDGLKISEESLLMVYGDQVVTGRKVVSGNVDIDGSLMVNGLINSVDINDLVNKAVLRDRTSNITGIKSFKQPLTITSLEAPTVSGIDVLQLNRKLDTNFSTRHLEDRLEEIEGVVSHMQESFRRQAIIFQYYELFQEFELPTVYDWFYVSVSGSDVSELLLVLDSSSSEEPCSSVRIFGFDEFSNLFLPARQELWASNAISIKSLTLNSTLLFVANKNPNPPCSKSSSLGKTTIDIYVWQVDQFKNLPSLEIEEVMDMAVFKDETKACLVVLEVDTRVYCSDDYKKWNTNEILLTTGGHKVSILQSRKTIMAIVADDTSYMRSYWEGQRFVDVYIWDSSEKQFGSPKQVIRSTFTQSVALAKHKEGSSEEVFLIVAEGSIPRIQNKPKIIIYKYDAVSEVFQKYQVVEDYGIVEWILLRNGELLLFLVDSVQAKFKVYQHKGVSGFVKIDEIRSYGVSKVHPFIRSDPEDSINHYLALTGHLSSKHAMQTEVFAKILKSKVKGRPLIS